MQKKIIALAIASALTVPAMAYAEATISGQINMSIDYRNDGMASSGTSYNLASNQSRLIFKGAEDLGSGTSVIWQLDNRFNADTGTATGMFLGNTYLGVQSNDFGTLRFGVIDTPYKASTRNLDVFFDVAGDNRSALGGLMSGHDLRTNNSINYTSPSMGGFSVAAASVFGSEGATSADKKGTMYSLAGMYNMSGIYATLAYQSLKAGTVGDLGPTGIMTGAAVDDKSTALKLGGGFSMDAFTVNAVVERVKDTVAIGSVETTGTNMYLAGKFALGDADSVRAAYTKRGETDTAGVKNADDASQIAIGFAHDMSKATSVYATYAKTTANGTLPDPSVLSFGMKHAF